MKPTIHLTTFLNERRLRDYPRLLLFTLWGVMVINIIFHRGWVGRFGGIIGVDFLCFYSSGILYRTSIENLYDLKAQAFLQQELLQPTQLNGTVNIFPYPPYVAPVFSALTWLPLNWSLFLFFVFSMIISCFSIYFIYHYLVPENLKNHISSTQTGILLFSSLPFILGIFFGQNSSITLFLLTAITITFFKKKWFYTGLISGLLIYKPHFVLGFLIIWIAWRRIDALVGFGITAFTWIGSFLIRDGFTPFRIYFSVLNQFLNFPYAEGLKLDVTPYAFILPLIPPGYSNIVKISNLLGIVILSFVLLILAIRVKPVSEKNMTIILILSLFFPYLISPRTLIYDLIPILLILVLWSRLLPSKNLLYLSIFAYLGPLILIGLTKILPVHLLVLIPLTLIGYFIRDSVYIFHQPDTPGIAI